MATIHNIGYDSYKSQLRYHEYHRTVMWLPAVWFSILVSSALLFFIPIEISGILLAFSVLSQILIHIQKYSYKKHENIIK